MTLDEGRYYIYFLLRYDGLWKSKFVALEKAGRHREFFFSYFVAILSSNEPAELSQWLCHDDVSINIYPFYYCYYLQESHNNNKMCRVNCLTEMANFKTSEATFVCCRSCNVLVRSSSALLCV